MKDRFPIKILAVSLLLPIIILSSCSGKDTAQASTVPQKDIGFAMGTVVNQTIYAADTEVIADVISLLTRIEKEMVSWRVSGSDVNKINTLAAMGEPIAVSGETAEYLTTALAIAKDSGGAFDPTIGYLTRLWGFDEGKNAVPEALGIQKSLANVGYEQITLENNTVKIPTEIALDLGAVGKGIGTDEMEKLLARKSVPGAIINFGGSSILSFGKKPDGSAWKVAITNPAAPDDYLGSLALSETYHISTSGDYEKFFEVDGKRYFHILDPHTGYPVDNGISSVTIISRSGTVSDALSTACFVLGMEESIPLLRKYRAEAIFVYGDKNVYITEGLKSKFELTAEEYSLAEVPGFKSGGAQ